VSSTDGAGSGIASLDVNFYDINGDSSWVRATTVDASTYDINTGHGWVHNFDLTTLKIRINDYAGNSTASTGLNNPIVLYDINVPGGLGGASTDFQKITNFSAVSGLTFEKVGKGKIVFNADVNMADRAVGQALKNLQSLIRIEDGNLGNKIINFNTSSFGPALAGTDVNVTLYGLPFATQPGLLHEGTRCDNNASACNDITYLGHNLFFHSFLGFSQYDADGNAPVGYTSSIDQAYIAADNDDAMSFTFAGAEVGATYNYEVSDGVHPDVTGTGTIATATDQITGIDVSSLNDGTLTLLTYLTDKAGNQGINVGDTVEKNTTNAVVTDVNSAKANGYYRAGVQIDLNVSFSRTVTVTGTPKILLNSDGNANYSSGTGTKNLIFSYIIGNDQDSADLNYSDTDSLILSDGNIVDTVAATGAILTLPNGNHSLGQNKNLVIDTNAPIVSISAPVDGTVYTDPLDADLSSDRYTIWTDYNMFAGALRYSIDGDANQSAGDTQGQVLPLSGSVGGINRSTNTVHSFQVFADDNAGNTGYASVSFYINATPTQQVVLPDANETDYSGSDVNADKNSILIAMGIDSNLGTIEIPSTFSSDKNVELDFSLLEDDSNAVYLTHSLTITREDENSGGSGNDYNLEIEFPADTNITGRADWDGKILLPTVKDDENYTAPGSGTILVLLEVGDLNTLNFSNPVKITLKGVGSSRKAGWSNASTGTLTEITTQCNGANDPSNISSGECYYQSGNDLIIWTYHFTFFAAFAPATTSSGTQTTGGSGGINNKPLCTWSCTEWSACDNNAQTRTCSKVDANCTGGVKPAETQTCVSGTTEEPSPTDTNYNPSDMNQPGTETPGVTDGTIESIIDAWPMIIVGILVIVIVAGFAYATMHKKGKKK
jgi:hypothetical protein